jgi:hopanoid C-3 methylase
VPEIVHITVNTPYPGTETWMTESPKFTTRAYRLFDVQHAVLPTRLPLERFYRELVATQQVLNKAHLGWAALRDTFVIAAKYLAQGQTNSVRMLWKFSSVYPERQAADHRREVKDPIRLPEPHGLMTKIDPAALCVHRPEGVSFG